MAAIGLTGAALALGIGAATAGVTPAAGGSATTTLAWGTAARVPGLAALNAGRLAQVASVSCASAGNCAAAGGYAPRPGAQLPFVVNEVRGVWGAARAIPGIAAPNAGGAAEATSVSCPSAGNCVVGGFYTDAARDQQAFVANETGGSWHAARELPGTAALNSAGNAEVLSVSCSGSGDCAAGGYYTVAGDVAYAMAFVASEKNGAWSAAEPVPGTVPGQGTRAEVFSLSCRGQGDCAAGGRATTSAGAPSTAFVVSESGGSWGRAQPVAGLGALDRRAASAAVGSVSCASPGNCVAGGYYADAGGHPSQPFVVAQSHGDWGRAQAIPGLAALNAGGYGAVQSVSCPSAGNCAVGGYYAPPSGRPQAFVAADRRGSWSTATRVPGLAALDHGHLSAVASVSCASAGNCSAGGSYTSRAFTGGNDQQAFVVDEAGGVWRTAIEVPGTAGLNAGQDAAVVSVSCGPAGQCAAGGFYDGDALNGFVVGKSLVALTSTSLALSAAKVTDGREQAEHLTVRVVSKHGGTPSGTVSVKAGTATVCLVTLRSGRGSCTLAARQLKPATYHLVAHWPGGPGFHGSASAARTLTVAK
jgi:hypothetical protein